SKGITRGKTDKADARDIAAYALSHVQELKLSELPQDDFIELRLLLAEREKVVKAINLFSATAENQNYLPAQVLKTTLHHNKIMMAALNKQLKQIEKSIDSLIQRNDVF